MALPQQVRGAYILIDRGKTSRHRQKILHGDAESGGLYYPRIGRGLGRGWAIQCSAKAQV